MLFLICREREDSNISTSRLQGKVALHRWTSTCIERGWSIFCVNGVVLSPDVVEADEFEVGAFEQRDG